MVSINPADRRLADTVVGGGLAVIVLVGLYGAVVAYRRTRAAEEMMGSMMGDAMGGMIIGPFWYLMSTLIVVIVVGGLYILVRETITYPPVTDLNAQPTTEKTEDASSANALPRPDMLAILPEDERRILTPVIESPGITQIALRDRTEFSKAKISQTVSALEKRGLLYREKQGRTYRIYPDPSLHQQ